MPGLVSKISRAVPRRTWVALAALCVVAAVVLWVAGQRDVAFVAAALGVVAWFLNYRVLLEGRSGADEAAGDEDEDEDDGVEADESDAHEAEAEKDKGRGEEDEA